MKRVLGVAAVVLVLVCTGLAVDTKTDYDHSVNFLNYHTFAWKGPASGNGIVSNSLVQSRIESAVNEALSEKGLRLGKANPDLYLVAHVSAQTVQDFNYWPPMGGWRHWGWMGPDVTVNRYVEGTTIIDVVDSKLNRLVWRSISTQTGDNLLDVQKEKKVEKMVEEAFKHFPPKETT